jgi:Cysteine-rich CPXCG
VCAASHTLTKSFARNHLAFISPRQCPRFRTRLFQFARTTLASDDLGVILDAMSEREDEDWSDDDIETEFPLGDGTAETEAIVYCPSCGEANEVALDPGGGSDQEYVEDCQVCCRPWLMYVKYGRDGSAEVEVYSSDS